MKNDELTPQIPQFIARYLQQIRLPLPESHKGQNGKLLVIGGSELFHSSIFWAADVASRIVDMVHFASPSNENNDLVRKRLKEGFWTGIVVDWTHIQTYIQEDNCILLGPGMERSDETRTIVMDLLTRFSDKKWVVDGGALQMVDPRLLSSHCIITPHQHELAQVALNYHQVEQGMQTGFENHVSDLTDEEKGAVLQQLIQQDVTVVLKGVADQVLNRHFSLDITGGNAGMTKGGTGDVLAGLVAALYCGHDALTAAVVGSYVNKHAAEQLWQTVGPYFNAGDLVHMVPQVLWQAVKSANQESDI